MKSMNQAAQKLALPPFLRRGLEAIRVGNGKDQKYLIRSIWKGQTYKFEPWQFFVLEVLPACDEYAKLASVFEDRFGYLITEKEVKELFSLVVDRGLFGEHAISHPMLASYKDINTALLVGKPSQKESFEKEKVNINYRAAQASLEPQATPKVEKNMEPNRKTGSNRAVHENEKPLPTLGLHPKALDDTINHDGGEDQNHLVRAMRKAKMSAAHVRGRTTETREEPPEASIQRKTDNSNLSLKVASSEAQGTPSAAKKNQPNLKNVTGSSVNVVEKTLPAGIQDAIGLDDSMSIKGFKIFNPSWLIKILHPLLLPFRHTIYLLPLLLIAALFIMARHTVLLAEDFTRLLFYTSFIKHALLSMITVNLAVTLATALIAYSYRATVSGFCIVFYMLFFLRFMVRIGNVKQLLRRERIWLHAAPLLLRLGFFSVGILVWFNTRTNHAVLANFGLAVASAGAISFFITVNPLIKSSGYHLLATFINVPDLKRKSFVALLNKFRGNVYKTADKNALVAYALVSTLYTLAITAAMLYIFGRFLEIQLGAASILVIVLIALLLLWRLFKNFKKFEEAYERSVQFERWRNRIFPEKESNQTEDKQSSPTLKYIRMSLLLTLLVVLFLPYKYEPGGNFIILPNEQQTITAEIAGIVEKINYDGGGGEMLTKGTVIGQLSYSDYMAQVKIYTAKINQQQAVINELKSKPKPEEVRLAQSALETQKTQAKFSKGKADRLKNLYEQGVVSFEDFEDARRMYEVDFDQVQEKLANLELVSSGATPDELAEAEAKLQSYQEERDHYQEKIEQSVFHMPFDGKLITLHLKQKIGSYLNKGEPLAVAEQTNQVKVESEIPEHDISYVKVNSEIRCRLHVYHDEDFYGLVKTIDANVTNESYGKVIKVVTLLENKDERLKSGMTGYAKISGEKMPFWKVLSLALIRFFKVEVWSWLP